jgi:hypothetical protein
MIASWVADVDCPTALPVRHALIPTHSKVRRNAQHP